MAKAKIVVTGIEEIDRKLRSLPLRIQKKVCSQAIRGGMKEVYAAVEAEAPVLTGTLKANVVVRAALHRKRGDVAIDVRIDANDETKRVSGTTGKTAFYPAIVEYKYDDFMERAFESSAENARRRAITLLKEGLDREIRAQG